jgi:hypothetical protein
MTPTRSQVESETSRETAGVDAAAHTDGTDGAASDIRALYFQELESTLAAGAPAPSQAQRGRRAVDDTGTWIATIPEGHSHQLRVSLHRDDRGRALVNVRVWERDRDGVRFFPMRHGLKILQAQLRPLAEALARACELVNEPPRRPR